MWAATVSLERDTLGWYKGYYIQNWMCNKAGCQVFFLALQAEGLVLQSAQSTLSIPFSKAIITAETDIWENQIINPCSWYKKYISGTKDDIIKILAPKSMSNTLGQVKHTNTNYIFKDSKKGVNPVFFSKTTAIDSK